MNITFSKMHGLGNDFVVLDETQQTYLLSPAQIRSLANRHTGIGFDQLLILGQPRQAESEFSYRIFNSDGGEVAQCGNGARCLGYFIHQKQLSHNNPVLVDTTDDLLTIERVEETLYQVAMGVPQFPQPTWQSSLTLPQGEFTFWQLSLGNPHAVTFVENLENIDVAGIGSTLNSLPQFPEGVNVSFMQILNESKIYLRVFERGASETMACGSGACAAAVAGIHLGKLNNVVTVKMPGGELQVTWQNSQDKVLLTGPVAQVFEGSMTL